MYVSPAKVMDHSLVRQKCFNGPRTKPTATPSSPCSVDHQAAADRRQELEEALEEERLSGWAEQGSAGWGDRQWGKAAASCHSVIVGSYLHRAGPRRHSNPSLTQG